MMLCIVCVLCTSTSYEIFAAEKRKEKEEGRREKNTSKHVFLGTCFLFVGGKIDFHHHLLHSCCFVCEKEINCVKIDLKAAAVCWLLNRFVFALCFCFLYQSSSAALFFKRQCISRSSSSLSRIRIIDTLTLNYIIA